VYEVDVEDNAILSLPSSLFALPNLSILRLGRNKIPQIPLALGGLTSLQVLTLNDNDLLRLPLSIRQLTSLTEFSAANNPNIDLPPASVVEQVTEPDIHAIKYHQRSASVRVSCRKTRKFSDLFL
jgi:Leucine-rich repeat (LRR) protein